MEVEVAGLNPKQCHTQVYLNGTRLNSVTDLVSSKPPCCNYVMNVPEQCHTKA